MVEKGVLLKGPGREGGQDTGEKTRSHIEKKGARSELRGGAGRGQGFSHEMVMQKGGVGEGRAITLGS